MVLTFSSWHRPATLLLFWATFLAADVQAQTWCGKNYKSTSPVAPPGGHFTLPDTSSTPLLAFRCSPVLRPYLPEDAQESDSVGVLVDTSIVLSRVANAVPITLSQSPGTLDVEVLVDGKVLASGKVPLNATKTTLPFSLSSLSPQTQPYNLSCTAKLDSQTFQATGSLSYLPPLPSGIGSVTKMDLRTGALVARPADGKGGAYAPILPIGFYTQFNGYLDQDFTIPAKLKAQGYIHAVPNFDNLTALDIVLDKMQDAGLYLMYDMRWTYMNSTSVTTEVNHIKSRPNLLLWYTGDEPDGTSDPLDATVKSSNLITSLDGGDGAGGAGYHPVSLVLNCQDYHFSEYTAGSDIVMQDAYMIGNNVTWSTQWGTVCTEDYGDCGCDNCKGTFADITTRMDQFKERLFINGWDRTKAVWTRWPTGKEFVIQSVLGINHGGLGVISWDDPTSTDIKASASTLALALPNMTPYILSPSATFSQITLRDVDYGLWTVGPNTLVLAANMDYSTQTVTLAELGLANGVGRIMQVFDSGSHVNADGRTLSFDSVGSGGFIVKT
ncbi:hypothetical protein BDN72DRAFT_869928 [Pluteus cervinus]|uniref:Uncharacterized protein n=1 Tax=Pluteus cervinus TaxID=181527 RepID=A0ACD3B101_9AGAR|nr:hypothetical protein BDN72DRAFT_869928 [Pluteus cervinus]